MYSCCISLSQILLKKILLESILFKFDHLTVFTQQTLIFGRHFERVHFLKLTFTDLWLS